MRNVLKIFNRLTLYYTRKRMLLFIIAIQTIVLSLIVLLFSNVIISDASSAGTFNYNYIRYFYTSCILILFIIAYLVTPIFSSKTLNDMYKYNVLDNLVSSKVSMLAIANAAFLRAFMYVVIVIAAATPIISISFYYGGIGIYTILKIFIYLLAFILLFTSLSMYVSSKVIDGNVSMILSYVFGFILLVFHVFFMRTVIASNFSLMVYSLIVVFVSFLLFLMEDFRATFIR